MSKSVNFSRNPVAIHAITANHANVNFKFEIDLKVYNYAGTEVGKVTQKGVPDLHGEFVFNGQTILHSLLQPDLPAFNQKLILPGTNSLLQWTADLKEFWGSPEPTRKSTVRIADNLVLMAGLSYLKFPGNTFVQEHVIRDRKFLTWHPDNKLVSPDQQEYLYYLNVGQAMPTAYLHALAFHPDGTSTEIDLGSLANATDKLLIIPAGYDQLGLSDLAKKVSSYQVWIDAGNSNKSEVRTYIVDNNYYKEKRYFLYQNSLGGFNILRTTGEAQESVEIDAQEGERIVGEEYSPDVSQFFSFGGGFRNKVKLSTGQLLYKEELRHLREFFSSRYIFEIIGGRFVQIILEGNRYNLGKSFNNEYSQEFEYRYAYRDPAFSK